MSISHLLNSRVAVSRLSQITQDGRSQWIYVDQPAPLNYIKVRLDMVFMRPGKDIPMAVEAGKAPDRMGICFAEVGSGLQAGDRITAIPNDSGAIPVPGTFDIRVIPDIPIDYSSGHHQEIQIVEVSQAFSDSVRPFPGGGE